MTAPDAADGAMSARRGRDQVDLRLVPPALTAWLATALATAPGVRPAFVEPVACATGAAAGLLGLLLVRRRAQGALAVACLACGAAAALSGTMRVDSRARGPLAGLARAHAPVDVELVVTGDPTQRPGRVVGVRRGDDVVLVPVRAERVADATRSWLVRQPMLVLASSPAWGALLPSQHARARGRLLPPLPGDTTAAALSIRGPPTFVGPPSHLQRVAGRLRAGLRNAAEVLPRAERGLLPGLVDGDTSRLDPGLRDDFRATGLTHLVAVSGPTVDRRTGRATLGHMGHRAAVYTRVSSDPRGIGRSVQEQQDECRRICEREGWDVVAVFTDNDRSASRFARRQRAAHRDLIAFVRSGGCDVLVTWECSRFHRDLSDYLALRDLCRCERVLWSYSGRTFDLDDADDEFTTGLDALLAEREAGTTRKRVQRAMRANAAAGRPHGKNVFGYRRNYDERTGALQSVESEPVASEAIREAARRVLAGETTAAVARDFASRGVPAPGRRGWTLETVRRLLLNPAYAGKRVYRGGVIGKASWPTLLTEAQASALHAKLTDPARRSTRETAVRHLGTGIYVCGVCDGPVAVQNNRGYPAYVCKRAFHVARKIEPVDELVTRVVVARLARPDALKLLREDEAPVVRKAAAELAELRARLDGFLDAAAAGTVSPTALSRIEAQLLPRIAAAEKAATPRHAPAVITDLAGRDDAARRWDALAVSQRREVLRALLAVRILPTRRGARTFDPTSVELVWR